MSGIFNLELSPSWPGLHTGFNVALNLASPRVLLVIAHYRDGRDMPTDSV